MEREEPLYAVAAHWTTHIGGYAGLVFTAFLAVAASTISPIYGILIGIAALIGFVMIELVRRSDQLVLYKDGIAREYHLITTKRVFAEYESIQDLEITQTVVDRIMGVATIHINTAGSAGQEITFNGIARFDDVAGAIRAKMEARSVDTPAS